MARHFLVLIVLSFAASMAAADDVCPRFAPEGVLLISASSRFSGGVAGSYQVFRPNQPISFAVQGWLCVNCIGPLYSIQPCDKLTWQFGDGTSLVSFGRTPVTHYYAATGDWNYTVSVTIENSLGTARTSQSLIIAEGTASLLRISPAEVQEADQVVWVPVIRTGNLQSHVSVAYQVRSPTGDNPSGTLDLGPGIDRTWIPVRVVDDDVSEWPAWFISILLTNPAGGAGVDYGFASGAIVKDDEPYPTATLTDVEVLESAGVARIPVMIDVPLSESAYYSLHFDGGTAAAGADYKASPGSGTFPARQKAAFVEIPIVDDAVAGGRGNDFAELPRRRPVVRRRARVSAVAQSCRPDHDPR